MRNKRAVALIMGALLLQGCQNITEEKIVTAKSGLSGARAIDEADAGDVEEQVQATDGMRVQDHIEDDEGIITVEVDATVKVPKADGIRLKRVESHVFRTRDMEKFQQTVMEGNPIYQRILGDSWDFLTKGEVGQIMEQLKDRMDDSDMTEDMVSYLENQIELYKVRQEYVPNTYQTREVPLQITYDPKAAEEYYSQEIYGSYSSSTNENIEGKEDVRNTPNTLWGGVNVGDTHYNFLLNNNWCSHWKKVYLVMSRGIYYENYHEMLNTYSDDLAYVEEALDENVVIDQAAAQKQAEEILHGLGYGDVQLESTEIAAKYEEYEVKSKRAICLHYVRKVDGIPVTYTDMRLTSAQITDQSQIDYSEDIRLVFDEEGLAEIYWENPSEIYDISEDYVFLLPFSDILQTFRQEVGNANSQDRGYLEKRNIYINKIKLGYMWIPDEGDESDMAGSLIPVWDFMGNSETEWMRTEDEEGVDSLETLERGEHSFLTVNAMDGSIVYGPMEIY